MSLIEIFVSSIYQANLMPILHSYICPSIYQNELYIFIHPLMHESIIYPLLLIVPPIIIAPHKISIYPLNCVYYYDNIFEFCKMQTVTTLLAQTPCKMSSELSLLLSQ
jgi:hypothetical protein